MTLLTLTPAPTPFQAGNILDSCPLGSGERCSPHHHLHPVSSVDMTSKPWILSSLWVYLLDLSYPSFICQISLGFKGFGTTSVPAHTSLLNLSTHTLPPTKHTPLSLQEWGPCELRLPTGEGVKSHP